MKVVVFGSGGFLGSAVAQELEQTGHEVLNGSDTETGERVDLSNEASVAEYFSKTQPDAIVNCAGIVDSSGGFENNPLFTRNILSAVKTAGITVNKVIVTGSAGEYGQVDSLPVPETAPLNASNPYALSKVEEEQAALRFSDENNVPVIVARVFNPLGVGMKPKFLVPGLLRQIKEIKNGEREAIEISSKDSPRDYVDVRDIARGYRLLIDGKPSERVYNVGSGTATTNAELLKMLLADCGITEVPKIIETATSVEPRIASQADMTRMDREFGWHPVLPLELTLKDIVHASE